MSPEQDNSLEFIRFALDRQVLRFGEFTLKSGRVSPYFFNAGEFNTGTSLAALGRFYARALVDAAVSFDMLFGPAYKGIPLAAATAIALANNHGREVPYAFNRKEIKDHAEGGQVVGAALQGRVLIVDDVISAGTSVRESVDIIQAAGATPCGVLIALDRQERGTGTASAVQQVRRQFDLPVIAIANLDSVLRYLQEHDGRPDELQAVRDYRARYGVAE